MMAVKRRRQHAGLARGSFRPQAVTGKRARGSRVQLNLILGFILLN